MLRKILAAILMMLSGQVSASEVWYTSNETTPDMPEMFSRPEEWAQTRALVNVIKIYYTQLAADKPGQCAMCEGNIWPTLQSHGMFERLHDWNIHLAIEAGSVKPGDCDAVKNTRAVIALIDKLKRVNTKLYAIAQDHPFFSGLVDCKVQSASKTAHYVKRYADSIQAHYKKVWPGEAVKIGLIQGYPEFTEKEIQESVELLILAGYKPAFVHLDIDRRRMVTLRISNARFKHELMQLKAYLASHDIPLGIIFWGQDGADKVKNAQQLIDLAIRVKTLYGTPEHIGIQHWMENHNHRKVVPNNLSEHEAYTGTNLTLQALEILEDAL